MNKLNRLAVFCGAYCGNRPEYLRAADELAKALVDANVELVYGGSNGGIMGRLASAMLNLGGKVIGVIPDILLPNEMPNRNLTELHVVNSIRERKRLLESLSDGFIMLPGGVGTLDEFFEVYTLAKIGVHQKPCGILNALNFYDTLIHFLNQTVQEGFLDTASHEMIVVESCPAQLLQRFQKYRSPVLQKMPVFEKI